jgi:hypothetical protein
MTDPTLGPPTHATITTTSTSATTAGSPVFRYVLSTILLLFAMGWATLLIVKKQTPSTVDGAVILVPLILGVAGLSQATISFVVTTIKPILSSWGRRDT